MNITLNLSPEVEKGLLTRAHEHGLTPDAFVQDLVEREASLSVARKLSGKQKARAFVEWATSHRPTRLLSDEAVSRAAMYSDRD